MESFLDVRNAGAKGRGIFAIEKINRGKLIEVAPIVLLSALNHKRIKLTCLIDYIFDAGKGKAPVALGTASLYNHDENPNADYELDNKKLLIFVTAGRTIYPGEEIKIDDGYDPKILSVKPEYTEGAV